MTVDSLLSVLQALKGYHPAQAATEAKVTLTVSVQREQVLQMLKDCSGSVLYFDVDALALDIEHYTTPVFGLARIGLYGGVEPPYTPVTQ